jgi:hypothetical protein
MSVMCLSFKITMLLKICLYIFTERNLLFTEIRIDQSDYDWLDMQLGCQRITQKTHEKIQ